MTNAILRYGDRSVEYQISLSERLTSKVLIHVHPDGTVEVEAPLDRDGLAIRKAVQKRARWVFQNLDANNEARAFALPREYAGGETHFYIGRRYRLSTKTEPDEPSMVKLVGGRIEVSLPVADPIAVKRRLKNWYRQHALDYFKRRIALVSGQIEWLHEIPTCKLVPMQQQWGSCSPAGVIHLNPNLIKAPRHCIDYVILHEICHLKEHNHSKRFYTLLTKHDPNWVTTKSDLDGLAEIILAD
jgi:predicted metal-dependent hydrolase